MSLFKLITHQSIRLCWPLFALALGFTAPTLSAAERNQQTYATPEAAMTALLDAALSGDVKHSRRIFGSQGKRLGSGDLVQARQERKRFVIAYHEKHFVRMDSEDRATIIFGGNDWPFPVPLVRMGNTWRFDTAAGVEETVNRRIGRNEMNAMQILLAIVDAQREYAEVDRNGDGVREYAQRFASHPGQLDGLYWPTRAGVAESPLGPLVARAVEAGYAVNADRPTPYWGYYYRILSAQGSDAQGGAYSYLAGNQMIGGFAILAYPAEYGASGVKSFMVNHDGVVFEKDLGAATTRIATQMNSFNPGAGWVATAKPTAQTAQGN